MSMEVHLPEPARLVRDMYGPLLDTLEQGGAIRDYLAALAGRLHEAHGQGHRGSAFILTNWLPRLNGKAEAAAMSSALTPDEARLAVAREHGWASWQAAWSEAQGPADSLLEQAVDATIHGRLADLEALLDRRPALATQRSTFAHRATLLIYLAANGVETHRQIVPSNAPAVAQRLLARGAEVNARADMYGGQWPALNLVQTSAHPSAAGVADELVRVLQAAGAAKADRG